MLPQTASRIKQMFPKTNFQFYDLLEMYKTGRGSIRNCLYVNTDGSFNEISQLANVYNTDWSWSPLLFDFDDDGYLDLMAAGNNSGMNVANLILLHFLKERQLVIWQQIRIFWI